ncbi:MAG: hypothetical protein FD164_1658 [Nitrospirae bacterium]|nr:MAG: hypothetical protein FD164_1658 [Nitrospirota bacterium]
MSEVLLEEERKMNRLFTLAVMALAMLPQIAFAAADKSPPIVIVADTRKFTGWEAWFTNLYNESHIYFALLTVAVIPIVGVLLGMMADVVMSRIGIDLKSRDLAEH